MLRSNVTKLSPLRRGFVMGYRRARHKARVALQAELAHFDAELEALQHDFHEIALELHRDHYARALDEAIAQRATLADIVLY